MPLRLRGSARPRGVFELYQSYAPVAAACAPSSSPFAVLLLAALVAPLGGALPARPAHGARASSATALRAARRRGCARGDLRAAAPVAEDGGDRTARRRRRARLQQPPARDQRLLRVPRRLARRRAPAALRERDPLGRRARRGADAPAARVQPQAGAAAARPQPERLGARDRDDAAPPDRRGRPRRARPRADAAAGRGRPEPDRPGAAQPRGQRARRDGRHAAR